MTTTVSGGGGSKSEPSLRGMIAFFDDEVIPHGSTRTAIPIDIIDHVTLDVTPVIGQSSVAINTSGWYLWVVHLISSSTPNNGITYHLDSGPNMDFRRGQIPQAYDLPTSARPISIDATGILLFVPAGHTFEIALNNLGANDQTIEGMIILQYLDPGTLD